MIKVLIVDDSALMRKHLTDLLGSQPDIEVRTARNGVEALTAIDDFDPNVVTLDINMPEMDGITCLSRIMLASPRPVVMVSSITEEGAETTLQALSLGAVDFVHKPGGTISLSIDKIHREILAKVRGAAEARVRRAPSLRGRIAEARSGLAGADRSLSGAGPSAAAPSGGKAEGATTALFGLVLVGVSTGGPGTLEQILPKLSAGFPWAVLVAQHMPGSFTGVFARRLNDIAALPIVEANRQMPIEPGTIYIAKGDADLLVTRGPLGPVASPVPASREHLWHPSVERLVTSALDVMPATSLIGVQLTGMGNDGAQAMALLKQRGGRTIAQDERTCVVFGMPNELIKLGGASLVLPSERIAGQLSAWLSRALSAEPRGNRHGAR